MTDRPLTESEQELLQLIVAFVSERGYPPSREEMWALSGGGRRGVERKLIGLRRKGFLTLDGHRMVRILGMRWKPEPAT
jgi:SOS-response transcriptional repressor LexA